MRSILVQGGHDPQMGVRLDTAMDLARVHGGHLTVLVDTPIDQYVTVDPYGGALLARDALEMAIKQDDALAKALAERLGNDDVPFDVAKVEMPLMDALGRSADLADLVVVSRSTGNPGDLALVATCPVLALPDDTPLRLPVGTACVAWDGSSQAARALKAAVPLLAAAGSVRVLTVLVEGSAEFPATDPLRYLARHDIKAELTELPCGKSVEETLAAEVARVQGNLLVMGAYGHSRLREFLFGGVTRFFLDELTAPPLFLAN
ncbi:universal stress protein [Novosphingobium sp.]|jgi:nucleotide-binding universal stress UspA family protein|uniref:universal stress protein n=1 Tax=Novosphingobium sp. TaxID=1874826 RepID=UPI0022C6FBB8|nr:universal stress protein [Novosphingobium sp.]MCZ8019145.1 universal stress protein [Novosphingobium sp.]MCZ8034953.1 universal stress protein [Novosphingobium sp.]MCZ8052521.1 universal stress protein [Novosphingobium sp.]MCZ8058620.1 universal stress protein [Novosphingobium sp.]MCZ8233017.1 universal stress protein [Novosphingobium sp.]